MFRHRIVKEGNASQMPQENDPLPEETSQEKSYSLHSLLRRRLLWWPLVSTTTTVRATRRSYYSVWMLTFVSLLSVLLWKISLYRATTTIETCVVGNLCDGNKGSLSRHPLFEGPANVETFFLNFQTMGGIVFFLHNPKTGGTTVREFLKRRIDESAANTITANVTSTTTTHKYHYLETHTKASWTAAVQQIEDYLGNHGPNGTILFVEDHVYPPIYRTLFPKLRRWKTMASTKNIPIFVFSMVRSPSSTYISGFNYYKVQNKQQEATVDNFLRYVQSKPNVQCQFFVGSSYCKASSSPTKSISICQQKLHTLFSEVVDWVTPTQSLSSDLLPLLGNLFVSENSTTENNDLGDGGIVVVQPRAFGPKPNKTLHILELSTEELEQLESLWMMDHQLYDMVMKHYNFDRVRDYLLNVNNRRRVAGASTNTNSGSGKVGN